ncbi:MAG: phytanoyl-CoA dioxygenase family protein [Myxococcota bacterium]
MRTLRDDEIAQFERDGVVVLRQVIPPDWLERMAAPLEAELRAVRSADLSEMARAIEARGGDTLVEGDAPAQGGFVAGTDHWRHDADFRAFALESPLAAAASALLRSRAVFLYEDSLLVKEPGTAEHTAFHQDMGYFHVQGEQVCTTWCPLDRVTPESGALRYVVGSHRDGRLYKPNFFVSNEEVPGTEGESVPDIAAGDFEVVSFDLEPGDVAVHHARTVHGAFPNLSTDRRRAISVRYCGDDARFALRPGAPTKPHHAELREGDPLGGEAAPRAALARA